MTVTENGKKKQKYFYGHTKQEVLRKIKEYREKGDAGPLFSECADEWWNVHERLIAPNTMKGYRPALARAVNHFGKTRLREIRPAHINAFLLDFIEETHAAQKTAKTQLMVINLICRYGVSKGYLDGNPARDLSIPKGLAHTKREMPDDEDIARIKAGTEAPFGMFAYWVLYTGCRRGELQALTWEDVNLEERTIQITKSLYHISNKPYIKRPKTEAGYRTVPILDRLLEHLRPSHGIIFPGSTGDYMTEMEFQKAWKNYTTATGIKCTPHQIRHAYATMLFEADIDEKDAQQLLGHAQISTTRDIYTHIRQSREKKIREKLFGMDL